MRLNITLLLTSTLTIAAVSADPGPRRCWRPGMPCSKLKRAGAVVSNTLDEPVDVTSAKAKVCFQSGQPCAKAKHAKDSLPPSVKDANLNNYGNGKNKNHDRPLCKKGELCPKGYKHIRARSLSHAEIEAQDDSNADHSFCHNEGQQCNRVKRTAEALAETLAEALAQRDADPKPEPRRCWRPGMPCSKAKRDLCFHNGQPCSNPKKALDHLEVAANDASGYVNKEK